MKKTFATLMAVAASSLALSLTGCSSGTSITVWCAEEITTLTTEQISDWVELYGETYGVDTSNFTVAAQSESDAAASILTDPEQADLFCFAQDQLSRLVLGSCLSAITADNEDYLSNISNNNDELSVAAATVGDVVYAFPITSDNGYFLYYDADFVEEYDVDVDSLESMIAACNDTGRTFYMNCGDGGAWYNAGFFMATGCESTWTVDSEGNFTAYTDTYNSEAGLVSMQAMYELCTASCYVDGYDASTGFSDNANNNGAAFVVDGTWDYTAADGLVDNLGCTDLPSFEAEDGTSYHLSSFSGYKLLGVTPQTDETKAAICYSLADYLSSETCQLERFESNSWGPSNIAAAASDAVAENPALAALALQSEYATPQGQYPGDWWDLAAALGESLESSDGTNFQALLDEYSAGLDDFLTA